MPANWKQSTNSQCKCSIYKMLNGTFTWRRWNNRKKYLIFGSMWFYFKWIFRSNLLSDIGQHKLWHSLHNDKLWVSVPSILSFNWLLRLVRYFLILGNKSEICTSFSVYTNGMKLLSYKKSKSPDMMSCLHGIRAITTQWVVLGHTFAMYPVHFNSK